MIIDILGAILWIAMFLTPIFTIPIVWRIFTIKKFFRVAIGLLLAAVLSYFLYHVSLAIIFRDGMGPG
jgi:predicted membrane protein